MQKRYHRFHLNKSRQSGWSEIHLRILAYRAFGKYAGRQCKIIAGTRGAATKKLIVRLKNCFKLIPDMVEDNGDQMYLELRNGTSFEGLQANPEAITGDTQIKCIMMDESAKWELVDDQPVMNSILPIVATNESDLFMLSTPKGPRGFFYEIDKGDNDEQWFKIKSNIWATEGYMYSKEEIEAMLADPTVDAAQEYLNQYTAGRNAIFPSPRSDKYEAESF